MNLLQICQAAADETGGERPGAVVGNGSPDAQRLLRFANKVGTRLMRDFPWQALRAEQTFTAIAGATQTGILPADFSRFVPETFWNRSSGMLMVGPVSPVEWGGRVAQGEIDPRQSPRFIIRGGAVAVTPALGGGEALAFEYVSVNWAESSVGVRQPQFQADTDVPLIDAELITLGVVFEYLSAVGQPAAAAFGAFQAAFREVSQNEMAASGVVQAGDIFGRRSRHFGGAPSARVDVL